MKGGGNQLGFSVTIAIYLGFECIDRNLLGSSQGVDIDCNLEWLSKLNCELTFGWGSIICVEIDFFSGSGHRRLCVSFKWGSKLT